MGDEPVTKQDLDSFKDFVVSQLALDKSVISSEVQKSQEVASAALSASNSLKEQSEIKFNHTGNERNFKFNGQVLAKLVSLKDHLADLPPESEAFSILNETVELLQERNRKIRIGDSSEAGWLTVNHYESNPVSLSEDDDKSGRIFIPHRRIVKLLRSLLSLKSGSRSVTPRAVASVTGQIISFTPGFGNITLLMSRFLQSFVKLHSGWDCPLDFRSYQFFSECLQEIDFWLSNCARLNGRSLTRYSLPVTLVFSDASSFACGGCAFRVDSEEFDLFFQAFSSLESGLDGNARELLAILYGLKSFRASLTGKVVKVFTDSKNAASISAKGSNSLRLHALALENFAYCAAHDISLEVEWIPRSLNSYADSVSRVVDYDDWAVSTIFFQQVSSIFGPFDVDRFASSLSDKCERFYSKFWCPGCEGVDAFTASWGGVNNYLVPPVFLVARTLAHLETSRAHATPIAPKWPSASFWPYLFPLGHPRDSVSRIIEFSDPSGIFDDSHLGFPTIFSACGFRAPVLVIYLDASSRV